MKKRNFECRLYDNMGLEPHPHHEIEIIYVLSGSGYLKTEETQKELKENDFYIVNADERFYFYRKNSVLYACLKICLDQVEDIVDMSDFTFLAGIADKVPDEITRKVKRSLARILRTEMDRNEMKIEFGSDPRNESFARVVVASFMTRTNPTLEEVADVKTAVSEAVTNSIIHGYKGEDGVIEIVSRIANRILYIEITDHGCGIEDVDKAMEPMYTTGTDGRSGMGFSFMEAFMDELTVESEPGVGTVVKMTKKIGTGCAM